MAALIITISNGLNNELNMKKKLYSIVPIVIGVISFFALTACGLDNPEPKPEPTPVPTPSPTPEGGDLEAVWGFGDDDITRYVYDDQGRVVEIIDRGDGYSDRYIYGEHKILFKNGSDDFQCSVNDGLITSGGCWDMCFIYNSKRQLIRAYDENDPDQWYNFIWNGDYLERVEFSDPREYLTKGEIKFVYKDYPGVNQSCLKLLNAMIMEGSLPFLGVWPFLMAEGYYGYIPTDKLISESSETSDVSWQDYLNQFSLEDINRYGCPETVVSILDGEKDKSKITWKRIK